MSSINQWYNQQQFSKQDAEKYYKTNVMVNTRKFPFIVINDDNHYQIIFGVDQDHAEWIAVKEFGFFNPIALHFESMENLKDAKQVLNLMENSGE